MARLVIVAPMGATIRGPVRLRLTPEQYAPRAHQLGKMDKKKCVHLNGDQAVTFKAGEIVEVLEGVSKLNRALFADQDEIDAAAQAKADAEAALKAESEAAELAKAKAEAEAQAGAGQ